jgi:hypothetical protein
MAAIHLRHDHDAAPPDRNELSADTRRVSAGNCFCFRKFNCDADNERSVRAKWSASRRPRRTGIEGAALSTPSMKAFDTQVDAH